MAVDDFDKLEPRSLSRTHLHLEEELDELKSVVSKFKKGGRPTIPEEEKRKVPHKVLFTQKEVDALRGVAESKKMDINKLILFALREVYGV